MDFTIRAFCSALSLLVSKLARMSMPSCSCDRPQIASVKSRNLAYREQWLRCLLYVCLVFRKRKDYLEVLLFRFSNGVILFPITIPFHSDNKDCAFLNEKEYPWLPEWLVEKDIATPTGLVLHWNDHDYQEFSFKKEK